MTQSQIIQRSASFCLALLFILFALSSCARKRPKSQVDAAAHQKEIAEWQQRRQTELKSENGWLTLVGLYWLKEGPNTMGTGLDNDIVLSLSSPRVVDIPVQNPPPR